MSGRSFIPDRSMSLKAAIRDGRAMKAAKGRRLAARLKRPVRQPTAEDIASISVDEPKEGWQFATDHYAAAERARK